MIKQYKLRFYNFRLVIFLLAISTFGIILVGSAREDLRSKQLAGVIIGLVIMIILSLMDYSWISNFQWIMYGINIALLLIVRLFGDSANGAARWIDFGFIRFQPTELSKIIIILFFARFFMDHEEDLNTFRTLAKSVIVVQPDQNLIKDYQRKRIMAFLYPENEEYGDDIEQQNNSKTAIASGELIGKKLSGDKEVASVNEGNFVSENQTDFIFAVAGEEYGFMGCCAIVLLLLAISVECIRMSLRAKDLSGRIICCGMASIVSLQSFLNICVATGIAPNTGTPLPFVSYGLTSLVSLYIGMGLVLNVGLQSSAYNKEIRKSTIDKKEDYL